MNGKLYDLENRRKQALEEMAKAKSYSELGEVEKMRHVHYAEALRLAHYPLSVQEKKEMNIETMNAIKSSNILREEINKLYLPISKKGYEKAAFNNLEMARELILTDWNRADKALMRAIDYAKEASLDMQVINKMAEKIYKMPFNRK